MIQPETTHSYGLDSATDSPRAAQTLAQLFWERTRRYGPRPAQRVKLGSQWTDVSWTALGAEVQELALGLIALGHRPGSVVAVLSRSRAEWVRADFAIFSAGGVTVPIYPTYATEGVAYILEDSEAETVFVEDREQAARVLEASRGSSRLHAVVLMEGEVAPTDAGPRLLTWGGLRALGREAHGQHEGTLTGRIAAGSPEDIATIVYTSGTTGQPKGVVQTHGNHLAVLRGVRQVTSLAEGEVHLLFLPLAHAFARFESFLAVDQGLVTAFAESLDKVPDNLREVAPHFIMSVPRVFEKLYARMQASVERSSPARRAIFSWALDAGRRASQCRREARRLPVGLRLEHALAHRLVFQKLHAALGGRLRFCVSGGAPLAAEIAEFFHAVGILILEGYGLTETCPLLAGNGPARYKLGTVGMPFPGVELRIADDGEILARGPNVARGYHRKPVETAEVFGPDGWFHTGDIGQIDADGFLRITDRKKDLIKTAGGSYVAPQQIENLLKMDPLVSQALVYGDRRPYPVALVTLSAEELRKFARQAGLTEKPATELVADPAVVERVRQTVDRVNGELASYARVKRFVVLPADFTQEGGELTPTLKLRRKAIHEKYADVIGTLYQG